MTQCDVSVQSMDFGGFLILAIKFIAFACYPPKSETSHDGGLVGLLYLWHISPKCTLCYGWLSIFFSRRFS